MWFFKRQSHCPIIQGFAIGGVRVTQRPRFPRLAALPGSPQCPLRVWEVAAYTAPMGPSPAMGQSPTPAACPASSPATHPAAAPRQAPPGLLGPLGGMAWGAAAVEDLGAVGQQRGAHLPPLLEAPRMGHPEAPPVADSGSRGVAAAEGSGLFLPAVGAGGVGRGLVGDGVRRGYRRFLVLLLAGQRFPPGPGRALHAGPRSGGGRGAVRHLGLLPGGRGRRRVGSRARRLPTRSAPGSSCPAPEDGQRCRGGVPGARERPAGRDGSGGGRRAGTGGAFRAPSSGSEAPPAPCAARTVSGK